MPADGSDEVARQIEVERKADQVRMDSWRNEAAHCAGLSLHVGDPPRMRSDAELQRDAARKVADRNAFHTSPRGRFLHAIIDMEQCGYPEATACRQLYSRALADEREPVNTQAVGRAVRILSEINHSSARAAIHALADLLAPELRVAA